MIREILEAERGLPLLLKNARQIKFTAVHEPASAPKIEADISFSRKNELLLVSARLYHMDKVFLKFKGEFREEK